MNVYTFTADEQESECCQCLDTERPAESLTAAQLVGNPGNGVTPTLGLVVKLLATYYSGVPVFFTRIARSIMSWMNTPTLRPS